MMLSLVIPIYKNEANLDRLLTALAGIPPRLPVEVEVVCVVDGSPDRSYEILRERLPQASFRSRLVLLSRNFGAFAAVAAGMEAGAGDYFAVLAADLQEPPELVIEFTKLLATGEADVVFGCRTGRTDPWLSELFSRLFWWLYRAFIVPDMPRGGVDVFGCTRQVRDCLLRCPEANTNLIALLFWLGFRRRYVSYVRLARQEGKSAWSVRKKVQYCLDSIFNFTDLPIRLLLTAGSVGMAFAVLFAIALIAAKIGGRIQVPGYSAIVLIVMFFGGLASLGLGIIGQYLWLTLQNSRRRPNWVVASAEKWPDPPERGTPSP
jgi:glycosyltransferase involved in cell wall biosynthesis